MDMYKFKWTRLQNEIFRLLCIKVFQSLTQREIALLLKVSPTAVSNALNELTNEKIVDVVKYKGKNNFFSIELNRENPKTVFLKRVENLKMIYESGLVEYLEEKFPGTAIVLFGSYSRGEDTMRSDIDIAIIGSKEKNISLSKFDKLLERKIFLNFYDSLSKINKELRENICNGIILEGGLEL